MLINRHDCIDILIKQNSEEAEKLLHYLINHQDININKTICKYFVDNNINIPTIEHYKLLNNKAHKIANNNPFLSKIYNFGSIFILFLYLIKSSNRIRRNNIPMEKPVCFPYSSAAM